MVVRYLRRARILPRRGAASAGARPAVARRVRVDRPRAGPRLRHRRRQRAARLRLDLRRLPRRGALRGGLARPAGPDGAADARASRRASSRTTCRAGPSSPSASWPSAAALGVARDRAAPYPAAFSTPGLPRARCSPPPSSWASAPGWRRSSGGSCAGPSRSPARRWSRADDAIRAQSIRAAAGRAWRCCSCVCCGVALGLQASDVAALRVTMVVPAARLPRPLAARLPWRRPGARRRRDARPAGARPRRDPRGRLPLAGRRPTSSCASRSRRSCSRAGSRAGDRLPSIRQLANDLGHRGRDGRARVPRARVRRRRDAPAGGTAPSSRGRRAGPRRRPSCSQAARSYADQAARTGAGLEDALTAVRVAFAAGRTA